MKPDNFLSLKDYFNYYISGLLWCASFFFLGRAILLWTNFVRQIEIRANSVSIIIIGILVVIIPYVVGFITLPLSEGIRALWQGGRKSNNRKRYPDPKQKLLKFEIRGIKDGFEGRRLSKIETDQLIESAEKVFAFKYPKEFFHLYFFPIRAYVLEYGNKSDILVDRARNLANFTESLLLPIPLVILSSGLFLFSDILSQNSCNLFVLLSIALKTPILMFLFLALAIGLHVLLVRRYFQLEEYWVKHVYRAFLILTSKRPEQINNNRSRER